jgi:hypothetical protein
VLSNFGQASLKVSAHGGGNFHMTAVNFEIHQQLLLKVRAHAHAWGAQQAPEILEVSL